MKKANNQKELTAMFNLTLSPSNEPEMTSDELEQLIFDAGDLCDCLFDLPVTDPVVDRSNVIIEQYYAGSAAMSINRDVLAGKVRKIYAK